MKRRLFTLLLALCLLASVAVAPVSAEETATDTATQPATEMVSDAKGECPCGCGQALDAITWKKWDVNATGAPTAGHYFLDGDYVQDGQYEIMAGDSVVLDLRGCTITSKSYSRLLLVYGRFHLIDTVGGGRFMSKVSGGAYGGVVMLSTNEVNDALFELCSGTITIDDTNKGSRRGGLIQVSQTATFRMTGGMLLNGTTVTASGTYTEPGGCVAGISSSCTIEILGGKIIGGESATHGGNIYNVGTTILKDCHILGGTAAKSGGNICQNGGSLTIDNCVIESGIANETQNGGGNICAMTNTTVSIKDSTVRNGWTANSGGNIFLGTTTVVIENTKIEAGVAKNRGNNLYASSACNSLTIRDCELPGDLGVIAKELILEGKVKIGLLNNGLRLYYGTTAAAPLDASGLTEGSEIYVGADRTFAQPGANINYFKGAIRTVLSETEDGLVGTRAANGELGGYCPHCGEQVAWKLFDPTTCLIQSCLKDSATDTDPACTGRHIESGHYYFGKTHTGFAQYYVGIYQDLADIKDVVIDLAGYSISATGRAFYIRGSSSNPQQSSLTMLDSYGASNVYGRGANNQPGGVIYNESSNLTIYGGTYIYNPVEGRNITGGGVILNGNSFKMYGGTLDGSAFTYTDQSTTEKTYTYYGACLYQYNGTQYDFTMTAGRMLGGYAQAGGCAYFGGNNQVNITGGQFTDGKANGGGGNIRMYGSDSYTKAEFNMSGAAVRDGRVEVTGAGGGNLGIHYGKVNISDSYIEGGYATAYGGNIMVGIKVTMTVTDTIVEGGYAAAQSGNVHLSSTNSYTTWNNCTVLNGSGTYGGNMTSGNGYNTLRGGAYLFGKARTSYGGNVVTNAGNVSATSPNNTQVLADDEGNAPLIAGGYAKTYGGNLYVGGVTNLQAAKLINGKADTSGKDLFVAKGSKQSKLTVGEGVTGKIWARFASALYGEGVYGQPIALTECQELNAEIIIDNYDNALLCAKDGQLFVGAIANIDAAGKHTWFTDTASAVAACDEDSYMKLFIAQDVVLTKDCAVDICGQTVNISGAYTLYGMDSSGDDYTAPTGKAVLSEETNLANDVTKGGKRYIATADDTGATFHRLENKLTGVALRPSADGIYYTGAFGCDETLVGNIASYGVAVSTVNAPGTDFLTDEDTLYTSFEGSTLQGGANVTGVLVEGIMKEEGRNAELNSAYGQMPVFAASYLTMKDGTVILSEPVAYSLRDIMTTVDDLIESDPINYRKLTNPMRDFYAKWEEMGMADWVFKKIITPPEDDVIDILMVGNSFNYYYVEELAGLAAAAGVKMRVCNVYYSGCKMSQHYNWWMAGDAPYQFFVTTAEEGRKGVSNVSLEWCLAQGEWDYISIQSLNITTSDPQQLMLDNKLYLDTFYGYFREQFPKATMLWHQTWSYAVGTAGNGTVTTAETQAANHQRNHDVARLICKEYDLINVPTGDAWAIIRAEGYDKLCARIGKGTNHEGDYYHDGDVGGGQYLNACVWFETITGQSVLGNTYRPVYTYNGTEIPLNSEMTYEKLQEAAHQAVLDMQNEEAAQ